MRGSLVAIGALTIFASACGSGESGVPEPPGPKDVRNFYALNPGSCWNYQSGLNVTRAEVTGPNATSIANETVYVWQFRPLGGGQPQEWFLDTENDAEIRLLRASEGIGAQRVTKRFTDPPAPLFMKVRRSVAGDLAPDDTRFTVETTPQTCGAGQNGTCEPGIAETHEWLVLQSDIDVDTPVGMRRGFQLEYRLRSAAESRSPRYTFVPGLGFTEIVDASGTTFAACALFVCDDASQCEGTADCSGPAVCGSG